MAENIQVQGFSINFFCNCFNFFFPGPFEPFFTEDLYGLVIVSCSKYDLYSKSKVKIDVDKVKPYYISLIEKVKLYILIIFLI